MTTLQERIRERMTETDLGYTSPCWVSDRGLNIWGYTSIRVNGRQVSTHRAAYGAFVGPIPDGLVLDHVCHDGRTCAASTHCLHRRCCNPAHLEVVTGPENTARGRNSVKTACKNDHEFTPANTGFTKAGHRVCRRCAVIASQKYQRKRIEQLPKRTSDHHPVVVTFG